VVALAGILAILWAWRLWPFQTPVVVTEDAYVRGQITVMAPQVNGYVARVEVTDFQHVEPGQVLIRIDDRIYAQRVAQSQGQRDAAAADVANAEQTLATDRATIEARRADLYSTQAELDRAKADETRVNELAARGSVSLRERDQIRATARSGAANVFKSRAGINIAQQQLKADEVSRGRLQAQLRTADAQLALAKIDLDHTVITAPRAGRLSEVSVRTGAYVTAGTALLYLVPDTLWVVANYKETQIHAMHVGQSVVFSVDALDAARLHGHVERLSPATGSEFSAIRSDNATGNFTKVVQRIPVRVSIDDNQELARRLRPGMSVIVHVDTSTAAGTPDVR
jgi:multidrug resistance efflux pump